jgi:cell division septal protein FtsQ
MTGFGYLIYGSCLLINKIEVQGGNKIPNETVTELAWKQANGKKLLILPQKNILFFSSNELSATLQAMYNLENIKVVKKYPHELFITFEEKKPAFYWLQDERLYYVSEKGTIITEATSIDFPLVENLTDIKISSTSSQVNLTPEYINYLLSLHGSLKNIPDLSIDKYKADAETFSVKVKLNNGPLLYFSIKESADAQIKKMEIIRRDPQKKNDFNKKQYIDLRYGTSVFIK